MGHHYRSSRPRPRRSASTRAQVRQRTGHIRDACQMEAFLDGLHQAFLSEVLDQLAEGL